MRNLTLLTDLYQLTMMNGYYEKKIQEDIVVFDMFFRKKSTDSLHTKNGGRRLMASADLLIA